MFKHIIKVWCLDNVQENKYEQLFNDLVEILQDIPEMGVATKSSVLVLFPKDHTKHYLWTEVYTEVIYAEVTLGYAVHECHRIIAAKKIAETIQCQFPNAKVKCRIPVWDHGTEYEA